MDKKKIVIIAVVFIALIVTICVCMGIKKVNKEKPEDTLSMYMSYLINGEYEKMYTLLDDKSKQNTSEEVFVSRNKNIYNGIEAKNITISNISSEEYENRNSKSNL